MTQLAIAYVYKRRAKPGDDDTAIEALAKALGIWTDWKAQKEDIAKRFPPAKPKKSRLPGLPKLPKPPK